MSAHPRFGPPGARDEAVTDVIGTILMVGLTVLMMVGLSLLMLTIEGPVDEIHADLSILVDPGNGFWSDGDETLTIVHRGGEAVPRGITIYVTIDGTTTTLKPTDQAFSDGEMTTGESWSLTTPIAQGVEVGVLVVEPKGNFIVTSTGTLANVTGQAPAGLLWDIPSDWDESTASDHVQHDISGDRDAGTLRLGYDHADARLLSAWTLDEDSGTVVLDVSGHAHDGVRSVATPSEPGVLGTTSFRFQDNGWVALQQQATAGGQATLTACAWFKTTFGGGSADDNLALIDFDGSEFFSLYVRGSDGHLAFATASGSATDAAGGATAVNDGTWHLGCGVYDGTDAIVYVDGAEDGRSSDPHGGDPLGTGVTRYGFLGDGSLASVFDGVRANRYYDGWIDEPRVYDDGLSAGQVQDLYDTAFGGTLTTSWRTGGSPIDLTDFKLDRVDVATGGGSVSVVVDVDADNDGTTDASSNPIALVDGTTDYTINGLSGVAETFRLRVTLTATDPTQAPRLGAAGISDGSVPILTYTYPSTGAATLGTLQDFLNAQSDSPPDVSATLTEEVGAPAQTTVTLSGNLVTTSTGLLLPENVLQSDDLRTRFSDAAQTLEIQGFSLPANADTIDAIAIGFEGQRSGGGGNSAELEVSYTFSGAPGASSGTFTVGDNADTAYGPVDIKPDRAWDPDDLSALHLVLTRNSPDASFRDADVDHLYVVVTYTTTGPTDLDATFDFTGVPVGVSQQLQVRYQTSGDTFGVQMWNGALWVSAGTLDSPTMGVLTHTMTVAEYNAGAPRIRFVDLDDTSGTGILTVDYARVVTTS